MSSSPEKSPVFLPFLSGAEPRREPEVIVTAPAEPFRMGEELWTTLLTDASLRAELDRLVDERIGAEIERRVGVGEQEWRQRAHEEARAEGLAEARSQAAREAQMLRGEVAAVCAEIRSAGSARLNQHEPVWMRALGTLLRRFLVARPEESADRIRSWLRESLEGLESSAEIRVYVSPASFERLTGNLGEGSGWRWIADANLKEGEIRCETETGGVLFSPGEQADRLERLLTELITEAGRAG